MKNKALIMSVLLLAMSASFLFAEPGSNENCCAPKPVGGMETLAENTFYPLLAEEYDFEGTVRVTFRVDEQGNVSHVQIIQSGGALFDESAITAIKTTQWSPAMQNGIAIAVQYSLPFEYRMN